MTVVRYNLEYNLSSDRTYAVHRYQVTVGRNVVLAPIVVHGVRSPIFPSATDVRLRPMALGLTADAQANT